MVEIIKGKAPVDDLNAIQVHSYSSSKDPSVRLATITHDYQSGEKRITFSTLVHKKPMSHEEAMAFALDYAEANGILRIYERRS